MGSRILCIAAACGALSAAVPAAAATSEDASLRMVLFEPTRGVTGNTYYRIPAMVTVQRTGQMFAFAERRAGDNDDYGDIDVVYRSSSDGGRSWSPIQTACDLGAATCGNPTAVVEQISGTVHLFMTSNPAGTCQRQDQIGKNGCTRTYGQGERRVRYLTARATGSGLRFTSDTPADLTAQLQPSDMRFDSVGPGAGIQLTHPGSPFQGRLLVPALRRTFISDDLGKTWRLAGGGLTKASSESTLMELASGLVLRNDRVRKADRHRFPTRLVSVSQDGGESFPASSYRDLPVPDPKVQASMIRLSQGQMFFANCDNPRRRRNLKIRHTTDGETWSQGTQVDVHCGYSSMAGTPDGALGILYERRSRTLGRLPGKPQDIVFRRYAPGAIR